jgi:putative two-component system protein, hydrogenase maturation factor HypX/HoxX
MPRRVGPIEVGRLLSGPLPFGSQEALRIGLVDRLVHSSPAEFTDAVWAAATELAEAADVPDRVRLKAKLLKQDEAVMSLSSYRQEELEDMHKIFFDPNPRTTACVRTSCARWFHCVPRSTSSGNGEGIALAEIER